MNSTLKMFEPTTLPNARSPCPRSTDITLTAISGELVPKATTVRPMISGGIPKRPASPEAPRTSASAPLMSSATPATNNTMVKESTSPPANHERQGSPLRPSAILRP